MFWYKCEVCLVPYKMINVMVRKMKEKVIICNSFSKNVYFHGFRISLYHILYNILPSSHNT
jgi:aspartate/methionine/tyrosine aminotransferase